MSACAALTSSRIGKPHCGRLGGFERARTAAVLIEATEYVAQRALRGSLLDERLKLERRQAQRAVEQLPIACDATVDVGEQLRAQLPADEHVRKESKQKDDCEVSCDDLQPHGGNSLENAARRSDFRSVAQVGLCAPR